MACPFDNPYIEDVSPRWDNHYLSWTRVRDNAFRLARSRGINTVDSDNIRGLLEYLYTPNELREIERRRVLSGR